jgi:hypothetical protein
VKITHGDRLGQRQQLIAEINPGIPSDGSSCHQEAPQTAVATTDIKQVSTWLGQFLYQAIKTRLRPLAALGKGLCQPGIKVLIQGQKLLNNFCAHLVSAFKQITKTFRKT